MWGLVGLLQMGVCLGGLMIKQHLVVYVHDEVLCT